MLSVMAPPQKKLKGVIVILSLSLYGAGVGSPMIADRDAWVWVNPKVTIAEIGGAQIFESLPTKLSGLGRLFASSGGMYLPLLYSEPGKSVGRYGPPPAV
jgi:hypothetical protein